MHILMLVMITMIVWPISGAMRYSRLLQQALELACIPEIKERLMDSTIQKNWIVCVQHLQLVRLYYPLVLFAMLFNTMTIWIMLAQQVSLPEIYLFVYCAFASAYGMAAIKFQSQPIWLRSWLTTLKLTRNCLLLEEINKKMTKKQQELEQAELLQDKATIDDVNCSLTYLIRYGEMLKEEIEQLEKPL